MDPPYVSCCCVYYRKPFARAAKYLACMAGTARGFAEFGKSDQNQRQTNAAVVCCLRFFISLLFDFANERSKTDIAGKLLLLNTGLLTTVEWHSSNQKSQAQIHATFWSLKRTDKRGVEKN